MNNVNYFDTHSHVQDRAFAADRDHVIERMKERGVSALVVGTDRRMSEEAIVLAEKHEHLWATVGLHPTDNAVEKFDAGAYEELARHPRVVGIGECGLDYFHEKSLEGRDRQKHLFLEHIQLASTVQKPLMIHCRPTVGTMDAYDDLLAILVSKYHPRAASFHGNVHFFAGNEQIAGEFLRRGFTLSFTGVITFTDQYDEIIHTTPLSSLMVETDCPYVAPVPYRGKRNEPAYVEEVVKRIAVIKGLPSSEVAHATVENARRVWGIGQ